MMQINFAHLRERSTSGGDINFAVFDANSTSGGDSGKSQVLADLTRRARASGLRVDQSALAFSEHGRIKFFGDTNLVKYLANGWRVHWTHTLTV